MNKNSNDTPKLWEIVAKITAKKNKLSKFDPVVSFTFDDAPLSAFMNGGEILESCGYRGTYYISTGLVGSLTAVGQQASLDKIKDFHGRGHEIGNHTYDHLNCKKASFMGIVGNIRRNSTALANVMSGSFAYPYGAVDARVRVAARLCTTSARGTTIGINRNVIDVMHLKAMKLYGRSGIEKCLALVEECAERGGWLIFYTHDVCRKPSDYGCTPEQLTQVVQAVSNNNLNVATVGKTIQMIKQKSTWKL